MSKVDAKLARQVAALDALIERAIRAADWEPGDAQRALQELRDDYHRHLATRRTGQ